MAADIPELLFDLARSALEQQERQVSELRSRTQALLTAAALVASFLGSTAIDRGGLDAAAVGALAALCATLVTCLFLLLPRRAEFTLDGRFTNTTRSRWSAWSGPPRRDRDPGPASCSVGLRIGGSVAR